MIVPGRRGGWLPYYVAAALGFAFMIGFADRTDPMSARIILALGSSAFAGVILLMGLLIMTLRGHRRFAFLEELPTEETMAQEKRMVLAAIKEIEFDHAMNKLNEADYSSLRQRYEAEALRVLKAIDDERAAWRKKAEALATRHLDDAGITSAKAPEKTPPAVPPKAESEGALQTCSKCETQNDADAVFCKKCGARITEDSA